MIRERRINILDCPIDNLSRKETVALIEDMIRQRLSCQHVVINVDKLLKVRRDRKLHDIISQCDIINADGMPIVWVSRWLGQPLPERVAGIDLMHDLVSLSAQKNYRIFFLGARQDVVQAVVGKYRMLYPDINIVGFRNGYWPESEEEDVVNEIRAAAPDILFVAMSSPKKEMFLNRYRQKLRVPFVMGVGGSFDVVAGYTQRAPLWMQRRGLEWLFRLMQEPKRMWRRYLIGNTQFVFIVAREMFGPKARRNSPQHQ